MTEPTDAEIAQTVADRIVSRFLKDERPAMQSAQPIMREEIAAALSQARRAGEKKGREEMRKWAAKVAEDTDDDNSCWSRNYEEGGYDFRPSAFRDLIAKAIRALDAGETP